MNELPQLVDTYGRVHTDLRLSVTDRCNIRCTYCMPASGIKFLPRQQILSFEEITRFVRVATDLGINRVRITGGEPLLRNALPRLVALLRENEALEDLAMTTNGVLLASLASDLKCAGLDRLNISLDTLDRKVFAKLARRDVLDRVLAGIDAALAAGFRGIRLNALAIRGVTESQILPLVRFAIGKGLHLRFIEYMPLDADANWQRQQVLAGEEIRAIIESQFGPLVAEQRHDDSQPAVDYRLPGGSLVGVIHPVTEPFCAACNRIRLTAEGQIRNCLFSTREWDAREVLRRSGSDEQLASLLRAAIREKKAGHGIDEQDFERPQRAMYQIGG